MSATADDRIDRPLRRGRFSPRTRIERGLLLDLVAVLEAAPKGLRRWSVMRALRERRRRAGHEIALKFEDEVERLFREFCAAEEGGEDGKDAGIKPFFRPKDTAGEVWAADPARLAAFLAGGGATG